MSLPELCALAGTMCIAGAVTGMVQLWRDWRAPDQYGAHYRHGRIHRFIHPTT